MTLTKRTHYNPCFWTAYWNFDYLLNKRSNSTQYFRARDQKVFVLNLKSNKIYQGLTKNVFWKKYLGLAELTEEGVMDFVRRNFPNDIDEINTYYSKNDPNDLLDFENFFTIMEKSYREQLENLILRNSDISISEKSFLTFFILFQMIRNPSSLEKVIEAFKLNGFSKFEVFLTLRNQLIDVMKLAKMCAPFSVPTWTIYKLKKNIFPLSDNPVMLKKGHIMVAVAPNIMIELNIHERCSEVMPCKIKKRISFFKYYDFIGRTIKNSSREIIFGDEKLLEKIKRSRRFKNRLKSTFANKVHI